MSGFRGDGGMGRWQRSCSAPRRLLRWPLVLVAVAVLVLECQVVAAQRLPGHCVDSPPNINGLAADWFMGGTTIPTHDSVVLHPGSSNRVGLMWSRFPLLTDKFQGTMTFTVNGPVAPDSSFAFWYVSENVSSTQSVTLWNTVQNQDRIVDRSWHAKWLESGMNFHGFKDRFEGLGVFFLGGSSPSISAVANDGRGPVRTGIPTTDAIKFDWRSGGQIQVQFRVEPDRAKIEVGGMRVEVPGPFKAGGYLGITTPGGDNEKNNFILLNSLEVINTDTNQRGEDIPMYGTSHPAEKIDVVAASSPYRDHRAESEAIVELTQAVFRLTSETQPIRRQMTQTIDMLYRRLDRMERDFSRLREDIDKKSGHDLHGEFSMIKEELANLGDVAYDMNPSRSNALFDLHQNLQHEKSTVHQDLDELTNQHTMLLEKLHNEQHNTLVGCIAIFSIVLIAGLALYYKFSVWEKKHNM